MKWIHLAAEGEYGEEGSLPERYIALEQIREIGVYISTIEITFVGGDNESQVWFELPRDSNQAASLLRWLDANSGNY